jgi:hypothetical protein
VEEGWGSSVHVARRHSGGASTTLTRSPRACASLQPNETWHPELHLSRADVKFYNNENGELYAVLMMRPCKNGKYLRGKSVPIVLSGGGTMIDPRSLWPNPTRVTNTQVGRGGAPARARVPVTRSGVAPTRAPREAGGVPEGNPFDIAVGMHACGSRGDR